MKRLAMKKNKIKAGTISQSIFKTFFLSLAIIANVHFAFLSEGLAQTGGIIPNGLNVFLDNNGKPLSSGKVYFYQPSTTTPKTTYSDINLTTPNTNPIVLDAAGRPNGSKSLFGTGNYRQILQDKNSNVIWDVTTSAAGSGSDGGSIATGDGDLVGTIKPWAGMVAPNQYMFTYGQEVSRTTFSALFTAITSSQAIFCNSGSPILTGVGDTTNFWVGMSVEVGCISGGVSTVASKTSSSVTLAANANLTQNTNAVFFPWGRGNGTTTFNLPDFRGIVPMGNNIMGGVASSNITDVYFGTQGASSSGALGGSQNSTLSLVNIPSHNHPVTDPGHVHTQSISGSGGSPGGFVQANVSQVYVSSGVNTFSNTTGITVNFTGGGIGLSATVSAVGSGYTNGSQTITVAGGTCSIQPQFTVTVSGNAFSGTPSLLTAGSCTVAPTNPAATTGGGGTGGTLNVVYSAQPFSQIQPSKTVNYIIKVTPDANSATASGVASLGGMTGSIACGSGLTCTGNTVTASTNLVIGGSSISSGATTKVLFDNAGVLGEYTISGSGNVAMTSNPVLTAPSLGVATGTSLALGGCTIGSAVICTTGNATFTGTLIAQANSATAFQVQNLGGVNALQVDASVGSLASGLKVTGAVTGGTVALASIDSGSNTNLSVNGKGSGTISIGGTSTGAVSIGAGGGGLTVINSFTATGLVGLGALAVGTQDTAIGYWGSTTASALAINNCSNALTYNTSTHVFGCNATAGTGTVTQVTAGTGLSATTNPIVATGTLSVNLSSFTTNLLADVAMSSANTYFSGPAATNGAQSGLWFAIGNVGIADTANAANVAFCKLWDGTTTVAITPPLRETATAVTTIQAVLIGTFTNPAGNIRMDCQTNTTTGVMRTGSANNSSNITIHRIQ